MKTIASLFIFTWLFCGCSSTYQIRSSAEANKRLEYKNGTIYLQDATQYEAADFHITGDSLMFTNKYLRKSKVVALSDITKVERTNHNRGIGQGMMMSLFTTFAILSTITVVNAEKFMDSESSSNPEMAYFVLGGTAAGAGLGAIGGGIIGSHETYMFNHDSLDGHLGRISSTNKDDK